MKNNVHVLPFALFLAVSMFSSTSKAQEIFELPEFDIILYDDVGKEVKEALKNPRMDRCYARFTQYSSTFAYEINKTKMFFFIPSNRVEFYCYSAVEPSLETPSDYVDAEFQLGPKPGVVALVFSNDLTTFDVAVKAVKEIDFKKVVRDVPPSIYEMPGMGISHTFGEWMMEDLFTSQRSSWGYGKVTDGYKEIIDDFKPDSYKHRYIIFFHSVVNDDNDELPKVKEPSLIVDYHNAINKGNPLHGGKFVNPFLYYVD